MRETVIYKRYVTLSFPCAHGGSEYVERKCRCGRLFVVCQKCHGSAKRCAGCRRWRGRVA